MSTEINKAFVQQFSNNLIILSQQKGSKLAGTVMRKDVTGKYAHFDRLGATVASLRTSRHGDTPLTDTPHSRRRVQLNDYEVADLIDHQDEVRMLIDPKSAYAQSMGSPCGGPSAGRDEPLPRWSARLDEHHNDGCRLVPRDRHAQHWIS